MISPASRIDGIEQYYFARKLKEIRAYNASHTTQIINLGIGSPDLVTEKSVIKTLISSSQTKEASQYQPYTGIPSLRAAMANWYDNNFKVVLDANSEILPLLGSKEGIMHLSMTFLERGDEVLIPNPGYPAYAACAKIAGATIRTFNLSPQNGYKPDLDFLQKSDLSKVKMMWVNYPNMPTGAVADLAFFEELVRFGERNEILICHDNPYTFILNESPLSILQAKNAIPWALELTSMSKNYNMAGWRIGALAADGEIIKQVLKFKSNMDSGMYKPLQEAAIEALSLDQVWFESINCEYMLRKIIAKLIINQLSCTISASEAGMFIWAKVPESMNGESLSDRILSEAKVFITPGFIFGDQGSDYIRISLCSPRHMLQESLERIRNAKIDIS